ncbi:Alanine--tRNA ligase [uncultured archaeon]|nr:Alanine--tRNA ligase [uncultured archaeon]
MRFFYEWKERGKEIEKLQALMAHAIADNAMMYAIKENRKLVELDKAPYTQKLAEEVVAKLSAAGYAAVVVNMDGFIVAVAPEGSGFDARELLKKHGAKGGGSANFARGKVEAKK